RRRHTRSYGDWSSDVCSSDLERRRGNHRLTAGIGQWLVAQVQQHVIEPLPQLPHEAFHEGRRDVRALLRTGNAAQHSSALAEARSEERRVGKEGGGSGGAGG